MKMKSGFTDTQGYQQPEYAGGGPSSRVCSRLSKDMTKQSGLYCHAHMHNKTWPQKPHKPNMKRKSTALQCRKLTGTLHYKVMRELGFCHFPAHTDSNKRTQSHNTGKLFISAVMSMLFLSLMTKEI